MLALRRKSHFGENIVSNAFPYVFQSFISSFQVSNIYQLKKEIEQILTEGEKQALTL